MTRRPSRNVGPGLRPLSSEAFSSTFTLAMSRARLSAADILHRGVVLSLVGVCIWGIGTGVVVYRNTLRMGRGSPNSDSLPPANSDYILFGVVSFNLLQR